ncbi:MAG: PHP domain-containing protein [Eubacteriales bacterium]|nr:PHP domain-containing protein [Eubacteriales bacterium]
MIDYKEEIKKYRMLDDIHTHTTFSHGKGSIEDNVKVAVQKGLRTIGISDHGPGHITYGVKRSNFPIMRKEIERLKPLYPQIEILLGVEANIINSSGHLDISEEEKKIFDYILAGYHYGIFGEAPFRAARIHLGNLLDTWRGNTADGARKNRNTELVIKALYENEIKVLTHPGDKGRFDVPALARACEETNTLMEISNWHEAPLVSALKESAKTGVAFIVSSDAHTPNRVGTFAGGLQRALEAGLDPDRILNLERIE